MALEVEEEREEEDGEEDDDEGGKTLNLSTSDDGQGNHSKISSYPDMFLFVEFTFQVMKAARWSRASVMKARYRR